MKKYNVTLWVVQGLLALLFAFAGIMKLVMPLDQMAGPVAAAGLVIIMAGATVITAMGGSIVPALFPLVIDVLAASVACGRTRLARVVTA